MKHTRILSVAIAASVVGLVTACDEQRPLFVVQTPGAQIPAAQITTAQPTIIAASPPTAAPPPTSAPTSTVLPGTPNPTSPRPAVTAGTSTLAANGLTCPPLTVLAANVQLAARVNGIGISLDLYTRQVAQAQAAMVSQGLDPNSAAGKEQIKSLKQQVLDQLINDVVIAQEADKQGVKITDNDVNGRLQQMVQDAGSVDKLNAYMAAHQMSLSDLCGQLRGQVAGEAMLARVTNTLPTSVPQVHARHILVSTAALAQQILAQVKQGKDFAALAKQYSIDEASKGNGGDLGWFPKGVMEPQFETVAFQLKPGQVSDVLQTQFGYHIIKVEEIDASRALPPELVQNARQSAFLAWLQALRDGLKIERLVQP